MVCTTVRPGSECPFMKSKGCSYIGGSCHPIVEACDGCERRVEYKAGWYCTACPEPKVKWKIGHCNLATHVKIEKETKAQKINPLKASKRANR